MVSLPPSPKTTLVVLLGASFWPRYPEFDASEAFTNSAKRLKEYFLNPQRFNLPTENLLDLFNSKQYAGGIDDEMVQFLDKHKKKSNDAPRDLLVYYIGHGGISENDSAFYLAIQQTRKDNPKGSSIEIDNLATTLKENARSLRRFLILDCCFAARAVKFFQGSGPMDAIRPKLFGAFEDQVRGTGFPSQGTAILCSSGLQIRSRILQDQTSTMFTEALLHMLDTGNPNQTGSLSLRTLHYLTGNFLRQTYKDEVPPKPEVHSPDQSEGDVAAVDFFPNFARVEIEVASVNTSVERYKEAVLEVWIDKRLDETKIERLTQLTSEIGLTQEQVALIEQEVMGDIKEAIWVHQVVREHQDQYRREIQAAWTNKQLEETKAAHLQRLANELHLSRRHIAAIEREIMGDVKENILQRQLKRIKVEEEQYHQVETQRNQRKVKGRQGVPVLTQPTQWHGARPILCLVTLQGIGFEQPPQPGLKNSGYADLLHEHLRNYLGTMLSDDPFRTREHPGENGPIYVESRWGDAVGMASREVGLERLGRWVRDRSITSTGDAPLVANDGHVSHIALVYSSQELKVDADLPPTSFASSNYDNIVRVLHTDLTNTLARIGHYRAVADQGTASFRSPIDLDSRTSKHRGQLAQSAPPPLRLMTALRNLEDDIASYVSDEDERERVKSFVSEALLRLAYRDDVGAIVLNTHSNGTVIAFDALCRLPKEVTQKIQAFVTAGSPLRKYVSLFRWGKKIESVNPFWNWYNFWDERDPVADPLEPPSIWHRGDEIISPYDHKLFSFIDPYIGTSNNIDVTDIKVDNVVKSVGGGLQAHNYWDNEEQFVKQLADIVRTLANTLHSYFQPDGL